MLEKNLVSHGRAEHTLVYSSMMKECYVAYAVHQNLVTAVCSHCKESCNFVEEN